LQAVATEIRSHYKPFEHLPQGKPFGHNPPKKTRPIDNPTGPLKEIQRAINRNLLRPIVLPNHIFGAVQHRSILGNAQLHHGASLLVTLDVRRCFPSITNVQIYQVWSRVLGCAPNIAKLLTVLTTFKRRLPQGAPTSPFLANLFIWSVDAGIRKESQQRNVIYSTWIDDLAFSGENARDLIQIAVRELRPYGLRLSHSKIRIMGPRSTKNLTGTRLGRQIVRAPKELRDRARAGIHNINTLSVAEFELGSYVTSLRGLINHIERLCPKDAVDLKEMLESTLASRKR
jgi:RNA-directed DNA polymerase